MGLTEVTRGHGCIRLIEDVAVDAKLDALVLYCMIDHGGETQILPDMVVWRRSGLRLRFDLDIDRETRSEEE